MSNQRVKLTVLGISYKEIKSGAYALILKQADGPYHIPVVIGAAEAQSIAMRMENVVTPRPLTHDLFVSFSHAFGVRLKEVFIYKFEDGVFSSELTFSDGKSEVMIDSRTSDAIAIAMRTGAPIFTTREIVEETGFMLEQVPDSDNASSPDPTPADPFAGETDDSSPLPEPKPENMTVEELERTLNQLIENEQYEEASRISAILKRKRNPDNQQ
ncbi:MAG: bifunctional nuclease family protein [Paramuribaculum sp.]|nr:bifunctional nuclease family protein [Paramuribaculum sp.]